MPVAIVTALVLLGVARSARSRYTRNWVYASQNKWGRRAIKLLLALFDWLIALIFMPMVLVVFVFYLPNGMQLLLFLITLGAVVIAGVRFAPSLTWVECRYGAEALRRAILLYRANAGEFSEPGSKEVKLRAFKEKVDQRVQFFVETIALTPDPDDQAAFDLEVQKVLGVKGGSELGFAPITEENLKTYVENRLRDQMRWYENRSHDESREMKVWQIVGLVIGAAGSLLVFLNQAQLIAATTTGAVVLSMIANLRMYGRIYPIYLATKRKLEPVYIDWKLGKYKGEGGAAKLVDTVEGYFEAEIDEWLRVVKQAMIENEARIMDSVGSLPYAPPVSDDNPVSDSSEDDSEPAAEEEPVLPKQPIVSNGSIDQTVTTNGKQDDKKPDDEIEKVDEPIA
ncbi:MAG: SLATT domain-containing protein [Anaerolinea sp.]|nr:SLATT domain-containing protein [Anaerolinea sp.]